MGCKSSTKFITSQWNKVQGMLLHSFVIASVLFLILNDGESVYYLFNPEFG